MTVGPGYGYDYDGQNIGPVASISVFSVFLAKRASRPRPCWRFGTVATP
jgi:hypothetical protein